MECDKEVKFLILKAASFKSHRITRADKENQWVIRSLHDSNNVAMQFSRIRLLLCNFAHQNLPHEQ